MLVAWLVRWWVKSWPCFITGQCFFLLTAWSSPFPPPPSPIRLICDKPTQQGPPLWAGFLCPSSSTQLIWLVFSVLFNGAVILLGETRKPIFDFWTQGTVHSASEMIYFRRVWEIYIKPPIIRLVLCSHLLIVLRIYSSSAGTLEKTRHGYEDFTYNPPQLPNTKDIIIAFCSQLVNGVNTRDEKKCWLLLQQLLGMISAAEVTNNGWNGWWQQLSHEWVTCLLNVYKAGSVMLCLGMYLGYPTIK